MHPPRRRRSRLLRIALSFGVAFLVLVVAAIAGVGLFVDPNDYKAEIAAAVKRATGRDLVINGRISIAPSFEPTIRASNVTLSNIAGGSQPQMLTIGRVEAEISLIPLLRRHLVINRLVLMQPKLLLETDAAGQPNWIFVPEGSKEQTSAPSAAASPREPMSFALQAVHMRDAEITWRNGISGRYLPMTIARLDASSEERDGPVTAQAEMTVSTLAVTATAQVGSLSRLQDRAATTPWPVRVEMEGGGVRLAVSGSVRQPLEARGYTLLVDVATKDLATFGPVVGRALPPLHDFAMSANLADTNGSTPMLSALTLQAGYSDLSSLLPGLKLDKVEFSAGSLNDPIRGEMSGEYSDAPFDIKGAFATPGALTGAGSHSPLPVDLAAELAGAQVTAKGTIATLASLSGVDVAATARVPDLAPFQRITGTPLPLLRDVTLQAHISDAPGGLRSGVVLNGATLTTQQGDLAGTATILYRDHPSIKGALSSTHLDGDAVFAALRPIFRRPDVEAAVGPPPSPPTENAAPPPPAPPPPPAQRLLVSDRPLPWAAFRRANADLDLDLSLADVRSRDISYHDVLGHLLLHGGKLSLDPLSAQMPGGRLDMTLAVDAANDPAPVSLSVHAPAFALKPLLTALDLPDDVTGSADLELDVHGVGNSPHAIAATADGRLSVAMVDGDIENRALAALLGDVVRNAHLTEALGGPGRTRVRCFAARLDAANGLVNVTTFVLDSSRLLLQGNGTIAMGDEALSLRLRPLLRVGGPGLVIPVKIGGTLAFPKVGLDNGGALGALMSGGGGNERGGDACPAALASAHDGREGQSAAAPAVAPAPAPSAKLPNAAQFLRSLVH